MEKRQRAESWICIKELLKESEVASLYSGGGRDSDVFSPKIESSISMELKPNTDTNQTVSFRKVHNNYCGDLDLTRGIWNENITEESLESPEIQQKDLKNGKNAENCDLDTLILQRELRAAKFKLDIAEKEITRLTLHIENMKKSHEMHVKSLEARAEVNLKDEKKLEAKLNEERNKIKEHYERVIENLKRSHEVLRKQESSNNNKLFPDPSINDTISLSYDHSTLVETPDFSRKCIQEKQQTPTDKEIMLETLETYQKSVEALSKQISVLEQKLESVPHLISFTASQLGTLYKSSTKIDHTDLIPILNSLSQLILHFS